MISLSAIDQFNVWDRFYSSCLAGRVHILLGHEGTAGTATDYRIQQIEIQIRVTTIGHPDAIWHTDWDGTVSDIQLRKSVDMNLFAMTE